MTAFGSPKAKLKIRGILAAYQSVGGSGVVVTAFSAKSVAL
jgi:hypothetical protein